MLKVARALLFILLVLYGLYTLSRSRTYQVLGTVIARVETAEPIVALTFDDGPLPGVTSTILDMLKSRGVRATFFLIGAEAEAHPAEAQALLAAGHELANHSYSHQRMLLQGVEWMRSEIVRTDEQLAKAGVKGVPLFRPPYGKKLFTLPYVLSQMNRPAITWDVEPESDPKIDGDTAAITKHVLERARAGSIILLHPWTESRGATRAAIGGIVDGLKAKGLRLVTVSELLQRRR